MNNLINKRIPTVGALIFLLIGVAVTTFLIQKNTNLLGKATPNLNPQDIKITNITSTSFTVSFTTNEKVAAALNLEGENVQTSLVLDGRDRASGTQGEYFSHYMTNSGLNPDTVYSFSIILGGETILDGEKKFTVTTGPEIETPAPSDYVTGLIVHPSGDTASDTIVYLETEGSQSVSTLTDKDGAYSFSLNNIRSSTLDKIITLEENQVINLEARYKNLSSKTSLKFTKSLGYIPTIILNDSYAFENGEANTTTVSSQLTNTSTNTAKNDAGELKITSPKSDQNLVDTRPTIQGTATPNTAIKITINSETAIKGEVKSNSAGIWSFRPPSSLPPGEHTVTVEMVGASGITKIIKQSFTVFAEGSQVQQSATPSATPRATASPTPTPTNVNLSLTPTPSVVTLSPTPIIASSVTPTSQTALSPTITIQSPGGPEQTLLLTFISFAFILAGSALLFILI